MYDLIVIGSGPAGEKGAAQAAWFGRRVALIERESVPGGACVNTGTIPSKTLRESALHLSGFRLRGFRDAVDVQIRRDVAVADLMHRKQLVVEREWERIDQNLERHEVVRYRGDARFLSAHEVAVGDEVLRGEVILIATGSSPFRPPNIPFDDQRVLDSDSILQIEQVPRTLAVVGAGVIGCEYAAIFGALGVKVHLINSRMPLLPFIDREISGILRGEMESRLGVTFHFGSEVEKLEQNGAEMRLTLKNGTSIECAKVLYSVGRVSNTADLNLAAAGVETGERGIIAVNEHFQTNVPNIYAAGDVIGFPALASTSMEQARVAMVHAFDLKYKTRVAAILPYGIYTIPELSTVGLSEEECLQRGIDYATGRAHYRNNARGQIIGDTKGLIKLVFDASSLELLGVHIVGENASELLHIGMVVMQFKGTINAFIDCVFNFPTLSDAYKYAAYDGLGNVARKRAAAVKEEP